MKRRVPGPLTPAGLLLRAALLSALFFAVHAAGWREYTSIISGTTHPDRMATVLGIAYAFFWFAFVLGVPVLVLGAGIYALLLLLRRPRPGPLPARGGPA
ncbi:MAG: hypothetical protein HY721_07340 [Planctomycetes bacterium]|nr:hypothetical protein [Planctomycetota bacterium]